MFSDKEKEAMLEYIHKLSQIIKNPHKLKQYFKGYALNHMWIPQIPWDIENLTDYHAAGNYSLIMCEAHFSQARQIFEILFSDEVTEAKEWQTKITELCKIPV